MKLKTAIDPRKALNKSIDCNDSAIHPLGNDLQQFGYMTAGDNAAHKYFRFSPDQDYQLEQIAHVYVER